MRKTIVHAFSDWDPVPILLLVVFVVAMAALRGFFDAAASVAASATTDAVFGRVMGMLERSRKKISR